MGVDEDIGGATVSACASIGEVVVVSMGAGGASGARTPRSGVVDESRGMPTADELAEGVWPQAARNTLAISFADPKRSVAAGARSRPLRANQSSRAGGNDALNLEGTGMGAYVIATASARLSVSPMNAFLPTSASNATTPSDQMSVRKSTFFRPMTCSGLM